LPWLTRITAAMFFFAANDLRGMQAATIPGLRRE
jgi:hypothetical protein